MDVFASSKSCLKTVSHMPGDICSLVERSFPFNEGATGIFHLFIKGMSLRLISTNLSRWKNMVRREYIVST